MTQLGGPPVDYLRECSNTSLRYFEMSKLEHVANLRRELAVLLDQMMEESALALFARWMLEGRAIPPQTSGSNSSDRAAESPKVNSLLADFIDSAGLIAPSSSGPTVRARHRDKGCAHSPPESGQPRRGGGLNVREHAAPPHGESRSDRRSERRGSRPARPSTPPLPETP